MAQISEILTHFPGPVTLNASRLKGLLALAVGLAFGVGGVIYIRDGSMWVGLPIALVFGLAAVFGAGMLLPGANRLVLDADGFEVSSLFKRRRTRWHDVSDFTSARIQPSHYEMVVYNDVAAKKSKLADLNIAITGRNSGLPDSYGWSTEALAELMNVWRERAMLRQG
jgi:hypothetical protein